MVVGSMPGANDPDKELKACLEKFPYPKWVRANILITQTDAPPAKPTYLNFKKLGETMKIWCMNMEAKHVLKMVAIFRTFNQDPVPYLDWEHLLTCMRRLITLDKLQILKDLVSLFKTNAQNPRQLAPGARWTLLSFAAFLGRAEIVDYLTGREGCFPAKIIDEVDEQGCTALVWAAASGSVASVSTLIDRNADMNTVWSTKETPLMIATYKGHAPVVRLLIDREADVNMMDENKDRHGTGWGPIQKACWWGHDNVLGELLLEYKHNPALDKTLRASAMLQGHENIAELLDHKRGPRSFPRVMVQLVLNSDIKANSVANINVLRTEVRTALCAALKTHGVEYSHVAVPHIEWPDEGSKVKIAHCEIRIRYSTVVAVWQEVKLKIEDDKSPIRKAAKLAVDAAQSKCTIEYPVRRMSETMSVVITEAIKKWQDLNPVIRGKKDPLAALDLKTAPSEFVQAAEALVQDMVLRYYEVTKHLSNDTAGMAKLKELPSKGRFFVELPAVIENLDEAGEPQEDPEDGINYVEEEEKAPQMMSQLMPFAEAREKVAAYDVRVEDVFEHFQTQDVQKRFEKIFEKIKEQRKQEEMHKDADAPTSTLLAPTYAGPKETKPVKEEVDDEETEQAGSTNNTVAQVKKGSILAQKKLKGILVPGKDLNESQKEWVAADLKDIVAVPHGDPQREIADVGLVLGGKCIDPGIKEKNVIDLKAKTRNPEEPNYLQIEDISRLGARFSNADALLECVERLMNIPTKQGQVCWIHNRFHTPSVLGYQEINVGIEVTLPGNKSFFCEVQLTLDAMHEAKKKSEPELYEKLNSRLEELLIPAEMHASLVRKLMQEFEILEQD